MAVVEQERRPVLLRRDRVVGALVDDLEVAHAELVADRRARVGAHRAGHDQRRLLRQVIGEREHLGRHLGLRHHALDGAGAVAHLEEVQLPARAPSREPAAQRDRAARVRADPFDRRHLRHASPTHSSGGERRQRLVAGRRGRLESAAGGPAMLGFRLNEEQESFRLAVRGFAEKALAPRVEELERTETFPMDLFRELGRLGYLGVGYPEEYGGGGGDVYVINGTKMFITNGNIADYCLVAAYTDPAKRGSGISMFIVDTRTPGFSVSRKLKKTGHHTSETAALSFDDMRVPVAALLGGTEGGFKQV